MTVEELDAILDGVVPAVREQIAKSFAKYESRLVALEARPHWTPELEAHIRGRLDALDQRAAVPGPIGERGPAGPEGPAGERGADGVAGRDGAPGPAGERGERGADGPSGAVGPSGERGLDGRDGQPGVPGRDGAAGERGEKGQDGAPGRDGTLEGATMAQVGDRTYEILRADGSRLGLLETPVPLYRGVYVAGTVYGKGDTVTYGGSMWIARDITSEKPGDGATAWQLAVKAGRDGREGKAGKDGAMGPRGERGEQGRNFS